MTGTPQEILIVSQSHLCRNPRVMKEAFALATAGYTVHILTAIYSSVLLEEDLEILKGSNISYHFHSDLRSRNLATLTDKAVKKLSTFLQSKLNIQSIHSVAYGARRLKKMCLAYNAHLYIMHQEAATIVGAQLANKHKVIFDMEDWYSQDLLPDAQKKRPIALLKKAEKDALIKGIYCFTTSEAMAAGLQNYYQVNRQPVVIYNSFNAIGNVADNNTAGSLKLYWFSQTIGPGRGLEFFIEAMAKSNLPWHLTLRGNVDADYKQQLLNKTAKKDTLVFLPLLKNEGILSDMLNYDIGLALEPADPPNKNLTISNKFFHYMAGGLPVIASNTLGHKEIGDKHPEIVFVYQNGDQNSLVNILNNAGKQLLNSPGIKHQVSLTYADLYDWENESKKLIQLVQDALK